MQNAAAALDFQYTSRYNKVYFDPEGGIFLNRMLGYLKGYERESVLAPLFKMLEATFDLFVPLVMADIVNVGIAAHDLHYILVRCGLLLLLAFIGLTCSLTAQYFSAKAAVGYSTAVRHALFAHIQRLSFSEMDTLSIRCKAGSTCFCACSCAAPLWCWVPWSWPLRSTPGRR